MFYCDKGIKMTLTKIDERKGLVQTYWKDVRERVASVDAV